MPINQSGLAGEDTEDWRQTKSEIGAMSVRVTAIEGGFSDMKTQFVALQQNVANGFAQQADSFATQMKELTHVVAKQGEKFSEALNAQNERFAASRQTNIPNLLVTIASVVTVIGGLGWVGFINPLNQGQSENKAKIDTVAAMALHKDDFRDYVTTMREWNSSLRDRQRADEDRYVADLKTAVTQPQVTEIEKRIERIERQLDAAEAPKR